MGSRGVIGALVALSLAGAAAAQPATTPWWRDVSRLAANDFEGRLTGSPGYLKAADWVAGKFREAGLRPGAGAGYFQTVAFKEERVLADRSRVELLGLGGARPLRIGPDLVLGARYAQPRAIEAPLVFIGYGLHLPEAGYDDLKGLDLRGKIVVTLAGGPSSLSAALKSHAGSYVLPRALEKAGVAGLVRIPNPASMDIPWPRIIALSGQPGMRLADPALQDFHGELFTATLNPETAGALFAGSGHSLAELLALSSAHKPLPTFALKGRLRAAVAAETREVTSPNVVGLLPGSDPALAAQYVVVSAHLDHLGVGVPIKGDAVYHGAMDNASGVASLIETARALAAGPRPKRSILFVAVCGEEKGLLGSLYFAERPTAPRSAVVADINMDEFLPLFPLRHLLVLGEGESSLGRMAHAVAAEHGYDTVPDPAPDRNIFVRSDQYSFIKAGVPSIALKFQGLPGSPEEKAEKDWNTFRYHSPQDDLTQPVDLKAADAFDAYLADLVRRAADAPERPTWNGDSFFRRFARGG